MTTYRFILFLVCWTGLSTTLKGQEIVTLEECREWAHENYPLISRYDIIQKTEEYTLSNAGKAWLPQLNVNGKATYQSDVTTLPFDSEAISAMIPGFDIPTLSKDQYQIVGEVSQSLWDGGNIRASRALTRAQTEVDRKQLESDLYSINDRVNQVYFGALLQDELIRQNELLQNELQINIDRIRSMIQNGVANQSDLESMEVEMLNAQQQEIGLLASRKAYRQMLAILTGKPIDPYTILQEPPVPSSPVRAEIHRPELDVFKAQESLIESRNLQINAGLMPQVGLFFQGGYGRPGLNFLENKFKAYYVTGLRFSWNMGNLYSLKNDRRLLQTNRQSVEVQRDVFLFNTDLQMTQQNTEIEKMQELMKSDREIIRLRTNIKEASAVKLENGIISVSDYIRDINSEDIARQTAVTHRIQYLMAVYNYLYTTNNPIAPLAP